MSEWCLIESDPGVFTELVEKVGVKGPQFDEVFDMDGQLTSSDSVRRYLLSYCELLMRCRHIYAPA